MGSKIVRGSVIIFAGNIIFRIGGYVYRFLMATLLGPAQYGLLGITLPFQGIFQTLAAGGLPPAIAKYVAEYEALNEHDMARQTIYTSLKIMVFLGFLMGFIMIFFAAPWLAYNYLGKPEASMLLQIVGYITPFSVIVGAFRGAFQGVYKMEYILYTRAIEQMAMILVATAFILIGLSVTGALIGTVLGFALASLSAVYIFKYHMAKYIPESTGNFVFTRKMELKLATKLVKFAIPVIITAIAEMLIYNVCTLVMGKYLTTTDVGYFAAVDSIARLPLMISISLATSILPAASEAFATKDKDTLQNYVSLSYRYALLFVIPICIGIARFSIPVLRIFYFTNSDYTNGALALAILAIGMTFYSVFSISTSIVQGIGNPRIPMYILIFGVVVTTVCNIYMVQAYGIAGGSLATTIACLAMMIPIVYLVFKLTDTKPPAISIGKIILASLIMGLICCFIPKTILGFIVALIITPFLYVVALVLLQFFTKDDLDNFRGYASKLGPLSGVFNKILDLVERIEFRN